MVSKRLHAVNIDNVSGISDVVIDEKARISIIYAVLAFDHRLFVKQKEFLKIISREFIIKRL